MRSQSVSVFLACQAHANCGCLLGRIPSDRVAPITGHQTGQEAVSPDSNIFLEGLADGTGGVCKIKAFTEEFEVARKMKHDGEMATGTG